MVCENASSGLGQKVGQGYYDQRIDQSVAMNLCMEWTIEARCPLALARRSHDLNSKKRGI